MIQRFATARRGARRAAVAALFAVASAGPLLAAPVITELMSGSPPHAQGDATIGIFGHSFVTPLQVFFSDGTNPTVAATPVAADLARGILVVRVPAGAATGNMKVVANGSDSNLFYFRRDAGTFNRGTSAVTGQVFNSSLVPVAGAVVVLLYPTGCDGDMGFWDHAVTDAGGNYTLHGQASEYFLFVFPPRVTNLAATALPVTAPATQPVALSGGTTVNGRVVLASSPSTGVANARVEFESDAFETIVTDATGNYSVILPQADYKLRATPPPSAVLGRSQPVTLSVGAGSPQSAAAVALSGGVRIYGTVRRLTDSKPMPGIRISAWPSGPGSSQSFETASLGDGGYSVVVPAGATYSVGTEVDDNEPYAAVQVDNIAVASSDVLQNLSLPDAGFIRGTASDASTSSPLGDMELYAYATPWSGGNPVARARTCEDGTYTLHVTPSASGYIVASGFSNESSYVPAAYRSGQAPAFFVCEGSPVAVASVGTVVSNIDLAVHDGAGSIEGSLTTQSSACTTSYASQTWVRVDDGTPHACGLGQQDWTLPNGSYRTQGLPNSSLLPVLRACIFPPGLPSGLCYDTKTYPAFNSVPVPAGGSQAGVNFCIGEPVQPLVAVTQVQVAKSPGQFTLSWPATGEPAAVAYRVRGTATVRPTALPGSFPADPAFTDLWNGAGTSATLPITSPYGFFLITPVGSTGMEGPSGHYPHAP